MNKILLVIFCFIVCTNFLSAQPKTYAKLDSVLIDANKSRVYWKGTKMNGAGKHEGIVSIKEGYLILDSLKAPQSGLIIIDMITIEVTDIPSHERIPKNRLQEHLKSDDFFFVEKYSTSTFYFDKITQSSDNTLLIIGLLTVRDVTKEISVPIRVINFDSAYSYSSTFKINHFDWNIAYQESYWKSFSSILNNNLVDPDIELTLELVLFRN